MINFTDCAVNKFKAYTSDGKRLMEFAHLKNTCVDAVIPAMREQKAI